MAEGTEGKTLNPTNLFSFMQNGIETCNTPSSDCPVEKTRFDHHVNDQDWFCLKHRCEMGTCDRHSAKSIHYGTLTKGL